MECVAILTERQRRQVPVVIVILTVSGAVPAPAAHPVFSWPHVQDREPQRAASH